MRKSAPTVVKRDPPVERSEQPDFKPGPEYFWKKGRWVYDPSRDDYNWRGGTWEKERVNRSSSSRATGSGEATAGSGTTSIGRRSSTNS